MGKSSRGKIGPLDISDGLIRYFEWDYDKNVVIEYEREGECNGCGDCCKAAIRFFVTAGVNPNDPQAAWEAAGNGGLSTTGKGQWSEIQIGDKRRFFQIQEITLGAHTCRHLTEDKKCDIHFTKPLFHKAWPMAPGQVSPFERCSYSFREIGRRPITPKQAPNAKKRRKAKG
jgi:Fe-S-cluster containining protein